MKHQILFRPKAEQDISDTWGFDVQNWAETKASSYLLGLSSVLDTIAEFTEIARERIEFLPPVKIHTYRSHSIIYQIVGGTIEVIRVVHSKSNWHGLLEK